MFASPVRYITHLKEVCEVVTPIYCRQGQHFGVTVKGIRVGFCPLCEPFYRQFNGPFSG